MFEYVTQLQNRIGMMVEHNASQMKQAAQWFADAIVNDQMIHILGTGHSHMIGLEGFIRAGGLGNINAFVPSPSR